MLSAIEPVKREPEPGSWDDPKGQRAIRIGRIVGPTVVLVPMGLLVFMRLGVRSARFTQPGGERSMLLVLGSLVAIGVVVAIAVYARRGFDQR